MGDLAEDRVYDGRSGKEDVYVAAGRGVAVVEVSERVGRFRLDHPCSARDLATADGLLAVATDEDVLLLDLAGDSGDRRNGGYVETGFGPASAVGFDGEALLAATDDEDEIGRLLDPRGEPTEWLTVADVDAPVRAIDGPLLAAGDGLYRLTTDEIVEVGLDDARDVASAGVPLAATGDGLYRLGNGWLAELDGEFVAVDAGGDGKAGCRPADDGPPADATRAHAATAGAVYAYDGEWTRREVREGPLADVAHGASTYAVTADGTVLVDRGDRWETRSLGFDEVGALVVP